jgi:hypothetical protein
VHALDTLSVVLHGVGQDSELLDLDFEDIAGMHVDGWFILAARKTPPFRAAM